MVAARERELGRPATLETMGGMGWERPLLGGAMWVFMLSFAGLPLTGGFVAKFYAFAAAWERGWTWLVIVGVIATAVSIYYYLAVIRSLYMRPALPMAAAAGGQPPRELVLSAAVVASVVVVVGSFFAVEPLIDLAREGRGLTRLPVLGSRRGWNAHLARPFGLPDRHARRQAGLRRPVPERQSEVPRSRSSSPSASTSSSSRTGTTTTSATRSRSTRSSRRG